VHNLAPAINDVKQNRWPLGHAKGAAFLLPAPERVKHFFAFFSTGKLHPLRCAYGRRTLTPSPRNHIMVR
jgi:hypothetical protein